VGHLTHACFCEVLSKTICTVRSPNRTLVPAMELTQ
jgi:hypothetical protein